MFYLIIKYYKFEKCVNVLSNFGQKVTCRHVHQQNLACVDRGMSGLVKRAQTGR